ncbi:MFS transporter [Oceanobacillus halophilus]|uniref:MFS transporter n=1 Tax=Oceanobacillus halophilus TaxID=930130 RepID=A0A495A456_9BACI|nr:glycoside-pentoside-hexuronide (GPH):cation symporter [Oceanobacillus halophilus]RKQ34328.1 MFS transporter [Oceanobacillus halophilus]
METSTVQEVQQQQEPEKKTTTKYDTSKRPFGKRDIIGYFTGDLGGNFSFDLINMFMFIYFTQFIGIDLVHYAAIILIIKIFDGINDPIIGMIIDRVQLKTRDKFKPWIIRMAPLLAITMPIMFYDASEWSYGAKIALFLGSNLLWTVLYTFVNVPYGALSSVMTTKPSQRTALSTARSIGGFVPNILYMLFIPMFLYSDVVVNGETRSVFQGELMFPITLITVVLTILCYYILYRNTEERIIHTNKKEAKGTYSFFGTLKDYFKNRAMIGLTLVAFAQILFINGSQQLNTLTFQLYFQDGRLNSFTIIITIIPTMIIGATIGNKLVKRYGKKEIVAYPMIISIAINIMMLLLPISNPFVWLALLALGSTFSFGLVMYTWAMVADAIDYQEWKTGKRNEGSVYSMYSMIRKLGQGFGAAIVPAAIAFLLPGLDLKEASTWTVEYATGVKNLSVLFPIIGLSLVMAAMFLVYNLDKKTLYHMQKDLGNETE